jgi:SAM-dependent methyltransferase
MDKKSSLPPNIKNSPVKRLPPPKLFTRVRNKLCRLICPRDKAPQVSYEIKDVFCRQMPSNQTIADIFQGAWFSSFPGQYRVVAGSVNHFDFSVDPRVQWTNQALNNGLQNARVLELGPYEAYNTWQLEQLGAKEVIAVENNKINYLKCLLVKEITGLKARFLHGDFIAYLEQCKKTGETFDFVWASGVLYHQTEPLKLLESISKVTSRVFVHTHYYDEEFLALNPDLKGHFNPGKNETRQCAGFDAVLHFKSYGGSNTGAAFSGGTQDFSFWLKKEDIFAFLEKLGFNKITIEVDTPNHSNGPGMCFLAEKVRAEQYAASGGPTGGQTFEKV